MNEPRQTDNPAPPPALVPAPVPEVLFQRVQRILHEYGWFILRNIIGWLLILTSPVLGAVVPGPGGLPVFLIGFALVTFPGKRKLTARVLRGRRLHIEDRFFTSVALLVSIAIPGIAWWIIWVRYEETIRRLIVDYTPKRSVYVLAPLLAVVLTWLVTRLSLKILNGLLKLLPRFRRKFRPWLRKKGLKLLPPRRKLAPEPLPEDEILEIDAKHQHRLRAGWKRAQPWLKRAAGVAVTAWIFAIMIRPLRQNWDVVQAQIAQIDAWRFLLASAMFAVFLLFFRALAWRRVLKGFGYKIPYAPATRIYATSEMARYLPGAIWQVVGRVYLCKPYGVPGAIVSTSQILEVCIFLFANVLIAGSCLLYYGAKMDPNARPWFITAIVLVPTLALLLHPKIFYGAANAILRKVGKKPIVKRLRGRKLIELLFWMILGLVWQSLAVYVITDPVLHLKLAWWWVVAGAYCLAWCAGFLAFWAPGGIGVRELVFVTTMQVVIPPQVRQQYFPDVAEFTGLLVLLGFILRLWTVAGEVMLVGASYVWDYRGAMNDPYAPGRVPPEATTAPTMTPTTSMPRGAFDAVSAADPPPARGPSPAGAAAVAATPDAPAPS